MPPGEAAEAAAFGRSAFGGGGAPGAGGLGDAGLGRSGRQVASSRAYRERDTSTAVAFLIGLWKAYLLPAVRAPAELFCGNGDRRTREVLGDLFQMFIDHFVNGRRSVRHDVLGIAMVACFSPEQQKVGVETKQRVPEEDKLLALGVRAMQFSYAAYGTNFLAEVFEAFSKRGSSGALMDANVAGMLFILKNTTIASVHDIIYSNFSASEKTNGRLPNHFVAFDHEVKAIVVAFRGTSSISDAITDANCLPKPFTFQGEEGLAHDGMLAGAHLADAALTHAIVMTAEAFPDYDVWIVGHSLGAGVASLYACILKDKFPRMRLKCYGFGCPGVLSLDLAQRCDEAAPGWMNIYINDHDNVPRLSYGSVVDLATCHDILWVHFKHKWDALCTTLRYSFGTTMLKAGPLKFLLDLVMLLVVLAVLTTVGYLAKVSTALGNFVPGLKAALISPSLHRKKKKEALNQEIHAAAEATIRAEGPLACSLGDGEETSPRVSPQASARAGSEKTGENGEGDAALAGLKFVGAEGLLHLSRKHGDAHPSGDVPGRDELPVARPYGVLVEGLSPRPSASAAAARDPPPGGVDVARKLTHLDKISRAKISAHEMLSSVSNTKLYPPNRVYHLRVTPGGIGSRGTFRMDLSEPKHFGWLLLSPNNLNHHMPWAYTNAMKLLILNKEHRRKMARARWAKAKRANALARAIGTFAAGRWVGDHSGLFDALARYDRMRQSFADWVQEVAFVGTHDSDPTAMQGKDVGQLETQVKEKFSGKKAWQRAGFKVRMGAAMSPRPFQHLNSEKRGALEDAFQKIHSKETEIIGSCKAAQDLAAAS